MKCSSCEKEKDKSVVFPCPSCKKNILRCLRCKRLSVKYKCDCGFEGP